MEQSCQDRNKIAIVGGGPAGIFCAICICDLFDTLSFNNFSVDIFDKNSVLKTILPTGNGRCNITNSIHDFKEFASNYPRGEKFLYSVFSRFSNLDTLSYFEKLGIKTYIQDDGRIFPKSNSSADVRNKMLNHLNKFANVNVIYKNIKSSFELQNYDFIVISTGSKDFGKLASSFGHTIVPFRKSLCRLIIKDYIFPKAVSVKTLSGDIMFNENSITGPLAFKLSSVNAFREFPYMVDIKLFNPEDLIEYAKSNTKKSVGNAVSNFIPKSLARIIVDDYSKNISEVSKDKLISYSNLNLTVVSCANSGEVVNAGGVDLDELDKNCKSKLVSNLWFCGDVLNIDGFCGGFNLQNCWSTAYVVANNIINSIMDNK